YIDELSSKAPIGSDGVIMLPNLTAEGGFFGLSLSTTAGDMARSVLEGVAYMLEDVITLLESKGMSVKKVYSLGGGSKSKLWCSIKADVVNKGIVQVGYAQTTSRGAAVLAAVADGIYKNVGEAVEKFKDQNTVFIPEKENVEKYKEYYKKYQKISGGINK
ncbi:MAG: xylulokinase, partial [Clostridia bacterium]|nr:xylulokinase [Clostridia bacterium]